MSTKIYSGFRMETDDVRVAFHQIQDFGKLLRPLAQRKLARWFNETAVEYLDDCAAGLREREQSACMHTWSLMWEKQRKLQTSRERDLDIDFSFDITIFPLKERIIGMTFTEQPGFHKLWMKRPFVSDYHYQNSSDRPDGISGSEWTNRRRNWDRALKVNDRPSQSGFNINLVDENLYPQEPYFVPRFQPSFDDRMNRVIKEWAIRLHGERLFPKEDKETCGQMIRRLTGTLGWLETTQDGLRERSRLWGEMKPKLKRIVTDDDLVKKG